jgi:hypothetical protein
MGEERERGMRGDNTHFKRVSVMEQRRGRPGVVPHGEEVGERGGWGTNTAIGPQRSEADGHERPGVRARRGQSGVTTADRWASATVWGSVGRELTTDMWASATVWVVGSAPFE